jgi:gamma-butyrobetaine dioxygenase
VPIPFHYINDGHHLHHVHRTFEVDPAAPRTAGGRTTRAIRHVNYSPPFQAPLEVATPGRPDIFGALRAFARVVAEPARVFRHRLSEGDAVLFDNRRVLHARTAFGEAADPTDEFENAAAEVFPPGRPDETQRWLKGCYLEADALLDRRRVMLDALAKST